MRRTLTALLVILLIEQCTQLHAYIPVERNDDWFSSGDNAVDEYGDYGSGFDDTEGSADVPLTGDQTPCIRMRDSQFSYPGSYRPQCTENGEFAPMQCHASSVECWCVDRNGLEIEGTMSRAPHRPDCSLYDRTSYDDDDDGGDIYISDTTTPRRGRGHYHPSSSTAPSADDDKDDDDETEVKKMPASDLRAFIRGEPLFLAALIGAAMLILLLIILILMFVVYRMRKKDEGSYSLDEPRHSFSYTRAKDQEFFA